MTRLQIYGSEDNEALSRQEDGELKRLRALIDEFAATTHGWFWETDADHRFTYFSPSVRDHTGVSPEWHYGKTRQELGKPDASSAVEWEIHLDLINRRLPFSDFVFRRVGPIALYAKGLTPELAPPTGGMGSEAFRKITPLGKVPSLVCDDGAVIAESAVINEYLNEQFPEPALLPAAPQDRARARMVVQMTDAYVFARYLPLFKTAKAEGKNSPAVAEGIKAVKEGLAAVEWVVDDGTYAVGNGLSLADCALAPALFYITEYAAEYFGAGDTLDYCAKLKSYWTRIQADPHVAQALADR